MGDSNYSEGEYSGTNPEEEDSKSNSEAEQKRKPKSDDLIIEAKNFFNFNKEDLGESIRKRTNVIYLDFMKLTEFSNKLSDEIMINPEETLSIIELAVEELGLVKNARVRLKNFSEAHQIKVRNIRSKHLNELVILEGIIRQASDVRPQVVNAKFECPSCGTVISVLQIEKKFREPSRCSCGRRGSFRLISKDMVDTQRLVIEESPESLSGGEQPKRMNIFVKEDLVEPKMEDKTTPGAKIKVIGILKEVPVPLPTGGLSTRFELAVEANNIIPMEETFEELDINDEDERQIHELSEDPKIFENLAKSIVPSVWGYEEIKKALVLQLFGGVRKQMSDGSKSRGDIHILLIGDPGVAKSVTLVFMSNISPKGRYVVGKSASGAGLTATVVRDEYLKGWSLEAGAMVLANKGLVCLHPDTKIITNNNVKNISSLFEESKLKEIKLEKTKAQINDKIIPIITYNENYSFSKANSSIISRKKYAGELLKIKFESGFSIKLTPNHQIINGNTILWKEAKDFKKGEFVLAPLKFPSHNEKVNILDILPDSWIVCLDKEEKKELKEIILQKYKNLTSFNKKYSIDKDILSGGKQFKIKLFKEIINDFGIYNEWKEKNLKYGRSKAGERLKISEITSELAYLIGFALGDGHIESNKKHSLLQITQSTKNYKQIERLKEYFNKISYRKLGEYKRNSQSIIRSKKVYSEHKVLYSGSNLICYLINHFIKNKLSNILELSDENIKAFIAGCLDSDGCISTKNCIKKGKKYDITHSEFLISNDSELNKNFMLSLRRLDCYSRLIEQKPICIIRTTGNLDVLHLLNSVKDYSVKYREIPIRKNLISSSSSKIPIETTANICRKITNEINTSKLNSAGISSVIYDYINKNRQPSREQLIKIREKLNLSEELNNEIELVTKRDYFLDKIVNIKKEKYKGYVYDLLVPETHNFIADGIVVHNCIDELEKMDPQDRSAMHEAMEQQCMLPDFKLLLSDGRQVEIGKFIDNLMEKSKSRVYKGKDCEILSVKDVELISTDFVKSFPFKADRISRHIAPKKFINIELVNGREITVTPEHPCWIIDNGKIITTSAEKLKEGMFFPVPSNIEIKTKNYKKGNDMLCKILGYHITNGCYELNKGKKTGIQFWNNDERLIIDYKNAVESYFKIKAGITKRKNQFAVRVISKKVVEEILKINPLLMEKGNKKIIPYKIMQFSNENIKYLLRALFDGDGTVVFQNRNGCRATLISENRELAEQVSDLLLRFDIQSSIFKDGKFFRVDITEQENLSKFLLNISFLSEKKKQRLEQYLEKEKTYRTIRDLIPNCTDKINKIFKELKISANKEIGHSIDLHVEKHRLFLQKLVLIAKKEALKDIKKNIKIIEELEELEKLAFGYARWIKIKKVSNINNNGIKWVYDVTIEPNRTFISNGMILHNTVTISKANVQACYSEDTEVLTEDGWKKYNEVKNLKIAQFNPRNKKISFLNHKGLFIYDYNKEMYHFKDRRNDILVTPNHKMFFREPRHKEFQAKPAEEITYKRIEFLNSGEYDNDEISKFILPPIKHKQNRVHEKYVHQHFPKEIPMDLWLEFMGYYVSEGGKETAPTIGITQKAGKNADKIEKCLTQLSKYIGFKLTKIPYKNYFKFKITNTQIYNFLTKNCGEHSEEKRIPLKITDLSKRQLKILFDALMLGDGSKDGKSFGSTSEELVNQIQIIGMLMGKSASKHLSYREKIRGNRQNFYGITFSNQTTPQIKQNSIKKINYKGKVWCFSTETGFFVTRRNGKIAIQGNSLKAQTSVLAAANPKFGRFDPFMPIPQQIDLPPTLINRFDIIFTLRDLPDRSKDEKIASHVLKEHLNESKDVLIDSNLLRKYVAYAKQKINPKLSPEAVDEIKKFYVDLRNKPVTSESAMRPIPISARQLQALIRMAEASAKLRLSETVSKEDAKQSIELMKYYLMQVGYDYESKTFDIDKISGKFSSSQRNKIFMVKEIITALESKMGKMIPYEELEKELEGKLGKDELEEVINRLIKDNELYRPKKGYVGVF